MEEKIQNSQTSNKMHFNALKAKADKDWLKNLKLQQCDNFLTSVKPSDHE
jgi:hypothetical protein